MTFMVKSDQKHNLVQLCIQASVFPTASSTHYHTTYLNPPLIALPPEFTFSDLYNEKPENSYLSFSLHLKNEAKFLIRQSCVLLGPEKSTQFCTLETKSVVTDFANLRKFGI